MKKFWIVMLVLSLALVANVATISAQGPSGTFVSGVSCQNLTSTNASIAVAVYESADIGGTSLGSFNDSINAGSNVLYFTGGATDKIGSLMASGSTGSVVVSSDQEIACSLNTQTTGGTTRIATSNGLPTESTASKLYVPQSLRIVDASNNCIFCSYVAIQNAGGAGATTVTAKFFDGTGAEVAAAQQTFSIPSNSSHVFYQDTNTNLPTNFNGSATFESDNGTNLAGTVVMFDGSSTLLTYDAFAAPATAGTATSFIGPRFVKNPSNTELQSGLACQNIGTAATTITADFNINVGGSITSGSVVKSNVAPNQSFLLSSTNFQGNGDAQNTTLHAIASGTGSVKVTSSVSDIACTFNENATAIGAINFQGNGSTYNGLKASSASTTVSFPQIVALGGNSLRGGFQYANTTGTAATCSHTYANSGGTLGTIANVALAGNDSNAIFAESEMLGSGIAAISNQAQSFNGSVTVTCDQPIVGIYNLAGLVLGGDSFTTNTGTNQ